MMETYRKFSNYFKYLLIFFFLLLCIFTLVFRYTLSIPLATEKSFYTVVAPGTNLRTLAWNLKKQGILESPSSFILLGKLKGVSKKIKPGEYFFEANTSASRILDKMARGDVILHRFTIIEGWTFAQLLKSLQKNSYLIHHYKGQTTTATLRDLGFPLRNPEGLFFPTTYYFSLGTSDEDLLKQSYQLMDKKLKAAFLHRDVNLPYKNTYEVLIAASLVEKETAQLKEKPLVAGVIKRRLSQGMRLQIDSSVIYGLNESYEGKLTLANLHTDTPYNTYTRAGLPPTPICLPSLSSILAVVHPAAGDSLYFVARGDGTHVFSAHLAQQVEAVKRYQVDTRFPPFYFFSKRSPSLPGYLDKDLSNLLLLSTPGDP